MGEVLVVPAGEVVELAGAAAEDGYPRALTVAAFEAIVQNEYERAEDFCVLARQAVHDLPAQRCDPRAEIDVNLVLAQISLARRFRRGGLGVLAGRQARGALWQCRAFVK